MKRLYVGGLGHSVTEKDLKDRFGKFGDVSDVEIITRKDDQGAALKTFGYINIDITDAEYKRCIGILNKSMWKGGTLLIQLAKESFLHRLAEERQQQVEKVKTPKIVPQEKILDSLKAAGVENFHMKAAVPGTEIPGHKDWVVSKFGRVLPVLNLKCKGKSKVFKYDPSKHCHNIKRLETADDETSVSRLTWEIEGGDDEISKKRRGEFPEQKLHSKRPKVDLSLYLSSGINASAAGNKNKMAIQQNGLAATKEGKQINKKSVRVFDSDADSEDEIRMLVAQEHSRSQKQTSLEDDDGNLEVVGDDFIVKSNAFWSGAEQNGVKSLLTSSKEDEEYDSADTDEILTQRKNPKSQVDQDSSTKSDDYELLSESDGGNDEESDEDNDDDDDEDSADSDYEAMMGNCYRLDLSLADLEQLAKNAEAISDDETVEEPKEEPKKPIKNSGNNPEDILASLLGDDTPEIENKKKKKKNQVTTSSLPAFIGTKELFGSPEPNLKRVAQNVDCESLKGLKSESVSKDSSQTPSSNRPSEQKLSTLKVQSISKEVIDIESNSENDSSGEESESSDESDVVLTSKTASATKSLKSIPENKPVTVSDNKSKTPIKPKQTNLSKSSSSDSSSSEESESSEEEDKSAFAPKTSSTQSSKTTPEIECQKMNTNESKTPVKPKQTKPSTSSSDSSSEESETSDDENESRTQPKDTKKKVESTLTVIHSTVVDARKQQQDNQKRLAALEQRRREAEQQKKLIQGALSNVDTANKSKRIVFDSDEDEDEATNKPEEQPAGQKKSLFDDDDSESDEDQDSTSKEKNNKPSGSKLFESEDEDEGAEEERFQIKPQFEGKAGEKLMKLQARFATDSRFQLDSRFLESDDETEDQETDAAAPKKDTEEELLEEKKKNLDILQSIVNINIQPQSTRKTKTFKDVSSLHYDPTREEHADFEMKAKTEEPKKESKAARRKKREEAEKLPEVSKDIYFDVSVDFKEVFGAAKETPEVEEKEKETITWDKEAEEADDIVTPMEVSFTSNAEAQEDTSGGFKFSFFGDNSAAETTTKTDEYKIETLKGAKFSWQVDPRFQESSSDEEGPDEVEEDQSASSKITEEPTPSKKPFFFFCQGDERLKEGPGMFFRSGKLGDQREAWEEKRTSLREECRKKHRDAKRRQKPTMKT